MCGIAGVLDFRRRWTPEQLGRLAQTMADTMVHRGPDDSGVWSAPGVGFGHRRLSIIDLSPTGHQPMIAASGRHVICYNGEVFNADDLKRDLEARGVRFRGHSDTEVILEGCAAWGVEACVRRLIGMFAFAYWDGEEQALWLVRDRLGIKPLYWARTEGGLVFGSELRSLRAHPDFRAVVDRRAVVELLRYNYVPGDCAIFAGTEKLKPGHWLRVAEDGAVTSGCFWDLRAIIAESLPRKPVSEAEAVERTEALMSDAVRRRLVADVPLGAFLSGGIDSSTVVALMQKHSSQRVKTFTVGFDVGAYDESAHAAAVAAHLGTEHTMLRTDGPAARALVPAIADWFDEPFADASQVPTYLVSQLTRRHVTVALSGDGGDELFAGYTRYLWTHDLRRSLSPLPHPVRRLGAQALKLFPPHVWDQMARLLPKKIRPPQFGERLHKVADIMPATSVDEIYRRLTSVWLEPERGVLQGMPGRTVEPPPFPDPTDRMQYLDTVGYLPDDILTKVDRTSMAVSLEARVPLLDHRLVELVWQFPPEIKIRHGQGKWLLRQILYKHVPRALMERPKQGFAAPIGDWLRGPLRDWGETLLDERRLRQEGYFEPAALRTLWDEHQSGRRNRQYQLWGPLMFQAWLERWRPAAP
ncbi:MAG: asparagine synthase (glutamine-hydrolyzing) [Alphaproteobacteria bacterium]|nr:asparagine synthase (glutamine-hydrolyzing) [Alphaproteobacteria bacterium]